MLIKVVSTLSKKRIAEINKGQLFTLSAKELQGRIEVQKRIDELCADCPWKK